MDVFCELLERALVESKDASFSAASGNERPPWLEGGFATLSFST